MSNTEEQEKEAAPSVLIVEFAGPGLAEIKSIGSEGIVTNGQVAAAAQRLSCSASQEWTLPLAKMVVIDLIEEIVARTTASVIIALKNEKEEEKTQIITPPFLVPPLGRA